MGLDFLDFRILDLIDILLVATLLYYIYKLIRGTVAINIFIGIVIIYLVWKLTDFLNMEMLSSFLGLFSSVGAVMLIVVFQQEIRKFFLLIGSTNITNKNGIFKDFNFSKRSTDALDHIDEVINACEKMSESKTGALIVIRRSSNLDFVKNTGDEMDIKINEPIIQSIFYKNSTLHDGALVIEGEKITATRAILPVSNDRKIPLRFGLRHRAAVGITEKTDALALVVSEESGQISYIKDGDFCIFKDKDDLIDKIKNDIV
ncbi:diadenylate cyclase CdaA [Flavobacteriaceae bacterium 14752]|uniref:diadenylate cyclase CdaA n=1 Tax=Mesohalobacter salilacus TaxID=2491711 RepID=UPI000F62F3BA|nr:TIGR00159 family protein [Flavobacteriaceae bacterium 14752]